MTPEMEALGRRAVACKAWRPMDGMLLWYGIDPDYAALYGGTVWNPGRWDKGCDDGSGIPDLSDPATVGCLLALVREAWRSPPAHAAMGRALWEVRDLYLDTEGATQLGLTGARGVLCTGYTSEAEALVAALEAAP